MMFQTLASQKAVYNMNYVPPKLYGQLKSHKQGYPLRPVVAFYTDSSYKLAKFLAAWFRLHSAFSPAFTVQNSFSLTSELQNQQFPPESILVSFDISSMYTNIPVSKTIGFMLDPLSESHVSEESIGEFKRLITLCIGKNICSVSYTHLTLPTIYSV